MQRRGVLVCVAVEQSGPIGGHSRLARLTHSSLMSYHQSLRWVLTDGEAARLAFDALGCAQPWTRVEPWFVRLRHQARLHGSVLLAS